MKQIVNIRRTVGHVIRASILMGDGALLSQMQGEGHETRKSDVVDTRKFLTG